MSSLFLLNMFVGVVINTFNNEKERISHKTLLTETEAEFIELCTQVYQTKPEKQVSPKNNRFQFRMYEIANSSWFKRTIILCIILNTVILMMNWYGQNETLMSTLDWVNHVFSLVFTIEAVVKISAFEKKYFQDAWNLVDFFICIMSWIDFVLGFTINVQINSAIRIIRTFRVARLVKLIHNLKKLN